MTETPSHDLRSALYPNELELVALLKREAEHSGVWFSHSLVSAANLIERLARLRLASDTIGNGGGEAIALEAYRAAVRWVASDSWDGCSDCIKILQMARSLDDFEWTPDHHAQALKRLYERSGSAPVHPPAAEPVGLREAEDVGLRIADRIRQELTSGRQWSLGSMDKAQREEFEAEITSTCVAVCEQEFATPARTDDAAQAGGSVTQSDADAANAWMRDHLDGGNAPGSLCIAFAQHRERHAQAGGGVAAMREAAAKVAEDELVEIFEDSPETDTVCNEIVRHIAKAIRALPLPTQEVEPAAEGGEVDRLMHVIDRDRYIVAHGINAVQAALRSRYWLTEGRGPYEWDDERYQTEFAAAVEEIEKSLEPLSRVAWDKSDCTRLAERVIAAKEAAAELLKQPLGPRDMIATDIMPPICSKCAQAAYPTGAGEGERLRIGWWNDMKARGVSDEAAILKIQAALTPADARKGDG